MIRLGMWMLLGTVAAGAQSGAGMLAVVNQKEHSVVLVDPRTKTSVATVKVGVNGHEIAASPDGRTVYVPIYSNVGVGKEGTAGRTIDVIDVKTWTLKETIDLGRELRPHKPMFGPDGLLYVTTELAKSVSIVDVKKKAVVGEVPTGQAESHVLTISADGSRAYTANVGAGSVSVLDLKARKLVKVIPVAKRVQRIALSNDGRWAFTSDQDQPRVAVIDLKTNEVSRWIATQGTPYVTQPTADGKWLLVASRTGETGLLEVVDLATWKVTRTFSLAVAQNGGFLLHGGLVYLSEPLAGTIEVLNPASANPATWKLERPIVMTPGVDGLAWVNRE